MHGWGDRVFGGQRAAALKVGLLGAYVGRGIMLLLAAIVISNPWLRLIGAAYLFKLSVEHLAADYQEEFDEDIIQSGKGKGFWGVVLTVELADLAFSLDNVVAAVALSNHILIVMLGVALGILTMRFAAQVFTVLIEREPVLITAAYILVLNISQELLIEEIGLLFHTEIHFVSWQKFVISVVTLILAVIYARAPWLRRLLRPTLRLISHIFSILNDIMDMALRPFGWLLQGLGYAVKALFNVFASHPKGSESEA
jgi:tellurite resistance protein TerC